MSDHTPLHGRDAFATMTHEAIAAIRALRAKDVEAYRRHEEAFKAAQDRYYHAAHRLVSMDEAAAAGGLVIPSTPPPRPPVPES